VGGDGRSVTARHGTAENHVRDHHDLDDTIARPIADPDAGADVLFAPRLRGEQIAQVVQAVDRPLNVMVWANVPPIAALAESGVSPVSVGASFAFAASGALVQASRERQESGTYGLLEQAMVGYLQGARDAFSTAD
jgi:2-methylisocitrate lyase-like PEP mutase family enzyme